MSPYVIESLDNGTGPRYRLVGSGVTSKWYEGKDQLERLEDLRDLLNHVVRVNQEEGHGTIRNDDASCASCDKR
jgi:hypothetical protein